MTQDVNVYLIDFSGPEKEMVVHNEDDSYSIFLNARMSYDQQLHSYQHAMRHIENDDFSKEDVQDIEMVAHELSQTKPIRSDLFEKRIRKLKRERKKLQKQMREYEDAMQEIWPLIDTFALAEQRHLYGNDL